MYTKRCHTCPTYAPSHVMTLGHLIHHILVDAGKCNPTDLWQATTSPHPSNANLRPLRIPPPIKSEPPKPPHSILPLTLTTILTHATTLPPPHHFLPLQHQCPPPALAQQQQQQGQSNSSEGVAASGHRCQGGGLALVWDHCGCGNGRAGYVQGGLCAGVWLIERKWSAEDGERKGW
ncbi:hypothetical protein K439DRAFT_1615486 [Ramaria rubella]|nr:hypothetical protein K439DRAFT_1615486 [Ramaria rubella]